MMAIIGLIIGILILAAGLYYFAKEKDNAESRKIYGITALVGAVVSVGSLAMMLL